LWWHFDDFVAILRGLFHTMAQNGHRSPTGPIQQAPENS